MELEYIKEIIEKFIKETFKIFLLLFNVGFTILYIFASISVIIIFYKMYPDTAMIILKPLNTIFKILLQLIKVSGGMILGLLFGYLIISNIKLFEDLKSKIENNRIIQREKFIKEIVKRLKKK